MRTRNVAAVFALVGLALVAVLPLTDASGSVPYESSGITLSPKSPTPGGHVTVTDKGFRPGSEVTVLISHDKTKLFKDLGKSRANANGIAVEHVIIPKTFARGSTCYVKSEGVKVGGHSLTILTTVKLSKT